MDRDVAMRRYGSRSSPDICRGRAKLIVHSLLRNAGYMDGEKAL